MDVRTANQSQTPGQNSMIRASPPGPFYSPLPSFQQLSLGSPSDHTSCYNNLHVSNQGFHGDLSTLLPRKNTNNNIIYSNNADHTVRQISPDAHLPSMVPVSSQGRNIPPCSLPVMHEEMQHCKPEQMSLYSPHSPYQAISPPFSPPYVQQSSLNGPQSPLQKHLPFSPLSFGHCVNERNPQSPQPAFERTHAESSVSAGSIYNHAALPSSLIQQQPQCTLSQHSTGRFISNTYIICLHTRCRASHSS